MILNLETAAKVAEYLLQAKAIKLQPKEPFTWSSGWKSPIYCDNRITLSFPPIRTYIRQELAKAILEKYGAPDVIVGVATGAIAQGALVAEELGVPFAYVRASAKNHGLGNLIEGKVESGQRVVVIEDLISTAGSSLKAVEALKEVGATVLGMAAIFTYNFQISFNKLKEANCELITLSDYDALVQQALESSYITESDVTLIKDWRLDPSNWTGK
ncbi:MAG: orotate phosphoribosyltransferase [Flavobacteriales bacterium]|nr:orotate phosphoribosyltransferase [Flavobacteriales bacterium]|tara:strand:- start:10859 stop:11503 length:645 start_codon:yes stop_codon:yes gene_type:complete